MGHYYSKRIGESTRNDSYPETVGVREFLEGLGLQQDRDLLVSQGGMGDLAIP
jgi:hypothetical protein